FGEVFGTAHSLNRPFREGWPFYAILLGSACAAAGLVLIPHAPLEFIILAMPPALAFLLMLANDAELMGEHANNFWQNAAGVIVTVMLIVAGVGFGITTVFPGILVR